MENSDRIDCFDAVYSEFRILTTWVAGSARMRG